MESLSFGKINFMRRGKSPGSAKRVPRHSGGISRHASPSVLPANGPVAILQSTPVSHTSPIGSGRFVFSGKSGASERIPQMRSTNFGSIRKGSGFTGELGGGFRARKEAFESPQPFFNTRNRRCVRQAQISRRAKGFSWNDRYVRPFQQHLRNFRIRLRQRRSPSAIRQMPRDIRKRIKRP